LAKQPDDSILLFSGACAGMRTQRGRSQFPNRTH
jgi:hypothetical protein